MAKEAGTEAAVLLSEEQAPTPITASRSGRKKVAAAVVVLAAGALLAAIVLFGKRARSTEDGSLSLRGLQQLESCYCDCDWVTKDACPKESAVGTIKNCCFKHCCEMLWAPAPVAEAQEKPVKPSDQDSNLDTDLNQTMPLELNVTGSNASSGGASNLFWSFFR